jgi:hypothetical protein
MSRAYVPRAVAAIVALVAAASFAACSSEGLNQATVDALVPSVDSINVRFSCGAVDSIALRAPNGGPAWAVRRSKNETISWVVSANVTINSIAGLPLDSAGSQGGTPGTPFRSKVKGDAESKTYHYAIEATCHPAAGPDRHLILDPEFIVHP